VSAIDEYRHWWNNTDREKLKYSEKNLTQTHFVHYRSHMNWPEIGSGTVQ
jgi:hypothetical protein